MQRLSKSRACANLSRAFRDEDGPFFEKPPDFKDRGVDNSARSLALPKDCSSQSSSGE
ncbi:hypothetical protein AVEN_138994-1, partial [Araneus ventricosus]